MVLYIQVSTNKIVYNDNACSMEMEKEIKLNPVFDEI